jgi:hypothetical protein
MRAMPDGPRHAATFRKESELIAQALVCTVRPGPAGCPRGRRTFGLTTCPRDGNIGTCGSCLLTTGIDTENRE